MKAPQVCPSCGKSLRDPSVPHRGDRRIPAGFRDGVAYSKFRRMFTLAKVVEEPDGRFWECPNCTHHWQTASLAMVKRAS